MSGLERRVVLGFIALAVICSLAGVASAQYWFQSGADGSSLASNNQGASVTIQTIYQNASVGSLGFWVGETLSNGAFIQIGYEIVSTSGDYPQSCGPGVGGSSCSGSTYIKAGVPTWFWEYFPARYNGGAFYGGIGENGSVGLNGSYHTYSFKSVGNTWLLYVDNIQVGSVDLGTSTSGRYAPSGIAEYADVENSSSIMLPVIFKDLEFYSNGAYRLVPSGYSYISYGKGSNVNLPNPYGVEEVGSYVDRFMAGSGLSLTNATRLWSLGYSLTVNSDFGNLSSYENYTAYASVPISAPSAIYLGNGTRELFAGWKGVGPGSYSGPNNNAEVVLSGNVTETAEWQTQYLIGVDTQYNASGAGWYDSGTIAALSVPAKIMNVSPGTRVVFDGWSTGSNSSAITVYVNGPENVSAAWSTQYLVNLTSEYGTVSGNGWYNSGDGAAVTLSTAVVPINATSRLGFYKWSNGISTSNFTTTVDSPISASAIFLNEYLITLGVVNSYGSPIPNSDISDYVINNQSVSGQNLFLFAGKSYTIGSVGYEGQQVNVNYSFSPAGPGQISLKVPLYNVTIYTRTLLGSPVNASLSVTFSNGSRENLYTGNGGIASFSNVPYGAVSGYAVYAGISSTVSLRNGSVAIVEFPSPWLIGEIIVALIVLLLGAKLVARQIHKERE